MVGANDATTGQAIVAFVTLKGASDVEGEAGERLVQGAARPRGPRDRPHRQAAPDPADPGAAQDPAAAKSCAGSSATSPTTGRSATSRRCSTRRWSTPSRTTWRKVAERTRNSCEVAALDHTIVPVSDARRQRALLRRHPRVRGRGRGRALLGGAGQPRHAPAVRALGHRRRAPLRLHPDCRRSSTPPSPASRRRASPTGIPFTTSATCRDRARSSARTAWVAALYFFDPDRHLIEIRHD